MIEKLISPLIQEQFPEFYQEEGENFIAFVQAYYEWLELSNNALMQSRSLLDYRDVDATPEDFIIHFKEKYLRNIEFETTTNKRLLLKHSLDIYRSKGTDRAVDLLFKLVYGTGASVRRPADDIFKLSDGTWTTPTYIEVSYSPKTINLVGKQVTGVSSGASAFVEKYIKRKVQNSYVYILYVSNIVGEFAMDELLKADNDQVGMPTIQGSLSQIEIVEAGSSFNVGDIVQLRSMTGANGLARVANTASEAGIVDFLFVDGGYGYTINSDISISNTVLGISSVVANTGDVFSQFELVVQPITDITYSSLQGTFAEGQAVFSSVGAGSGRIMSINTNSSSMTLSRESGDFTTGGKIYISGNTANATIATSSNVDVTGYVTQIPTQVQLELSSNSGFVEQQAVFQVFSDTETANGTITQVLGSTITVANVNGTFISNSSVKIRGSQNTGFVTSISMQLPLHNISAPFSSCNQPIVYGTISGPTARVSSVASGNNAAFAIAGLDDTEVVSLNTDFLSGNNSSNVPYSTLLLNASTYGFPDKPSANISGNIWDTLHFQDFTIGEITGINGINPGTGYAAAPAIAIDEQYVSCFERKDYKFILSNTSLNFVVGETVTQVNPVPAYDLLLVSNTGWTNGEFVYTTTGNGNIINIGSTIRVANLQGSFSNGQTLHSIITTTNSSITTAYSNTQSVTAHGTVQVGGVGFLKVKREQFDNYWQVGGNNIVGQTTGATANLQMLMEWSNSTPIGLNAVVNDKVVTADGTVTSLVVTDSGYGYEEGSQVSFLLANNAGTGTVTSAAIGVGSGYFQSSKGFLSADKYLFDGDFYQEYSYEVLSKLPFDRYSDLLKKVLHIAGAKAFGSVELESDASLTLTSANTVSVQSTYVGADNRIIAITAPSVTLAKA